MFQFILAQDLLRVLLLQSQAILYSPTNQEFDSRNLFTMAAIQVDLAKLNDDHRTKRKISADQSKERKSTGINKWQLLEFKRVEVYLKTRQFNTFDAAFARKYLVEPRKKEEFVKFELGDLVWAKVKDWPWWPAMVAVDPHLDNYLKYSYGIRSNDACVHSSSDSNLFNLPYRFYHIISFTILWPGTISRLEQTMLHQAI